MTDGGRQSLGSVVARSWCIIGPVLSSCFCSVGSCAQQRDTRVLCGPALADRCAVGAGDASSATWRRSGSLCSSKSTTSTSSTSSTKRAPAPFCGKNPWSSENVRYVPTVFILPALSPYLPVCSCHRSQSNWYLSVYCVHFGNRILTGYRYIDI